MSASIWAPGNELVTVDSESTNLSQVFTATDSQVIFNLTLFSYAVGTGSIAVYRGGQRLILGTDWAETSSTSISLTGFSIAAGEIIEVVAVLGSASSASISAAASAAAAAASVTTALNAIATIPSMTGGADTVPVINSTNNGWLYKTASQLKTFLSLVVGTDVLAPNGDGSALTGIITVPSGCIASFARNTAPTGWLKANGAAVSRTTYSSLFSAIGTTFGAGDGSTTFNLPDLRGEFIRGWDDSRGVDSGRVFGSAQTDDFKSHTHSLGLRPNMSAGGGVSIDAGTAFGASGTTYATGGTETRPRNVAILMCIKY